MALPAYLRGDRREGAWAGQPAHSQLQITAITRDHGPRLARASDISREAGNLDFEAKSQFLKDARSKFFVTMCRLNPTHKVWFITSALKRLGHRVHLAGGARALPSAQ